MCVVYDGSTRLLFWRATLVQPEQWGVDFCIGELFKRPVFTGGRAPVFFPAPASASSARDRVTVRGVRTLPSDCLPSFVRVDLCCATQSGTEGSGVQGSFLWWGGGGAV